MFADSRGPAEAKAGHYRCRNVLRLESSRATSCRACLTHRRAQSYAGPFMPANGSIFGAMLQEFDGAARILNLEPGIWKILTSPKRQITVSCPVQMDNGEIEVFTGYRVQYNITLGPAKGGIRFH